MKMLREYKNKRRFVSTGMHVADGRGPAHCVFAGFRGRRHRQSQATDTQVFRCRE
jgi:hypothetical protein